MKQVAKGIIPPITINQQHLLDRIDREDYSGVFQKTKELLCQRGFQRSEHYFARGIHSLKQFYALVVLDPANAHAAPSPLERFWSAHISLDEEYRAFCHDIFGKRLEYHSIRSKNEAENLGRVYRHTLHVVSEVFPNVDRALWPEHNIYNNLICWHEGGSHALPDLQKHRLFEPRKTELRSFA